LGKKTEAKLKLGETICSQCEGSGKEKTWESGGYVITPECPKCLGVGKFDWIERIMGKPNRFYSSMEGWVDELSKDIAYEIDKEIIESVIQDACKEESEHNIK
jgi:hypothetical protein